MAYSLLPALALSNPFSLTIYDQIRENFAVGVPDIIAAKGDLPVGTTTDTVARLAVGANGAALVPDSSQTTGLAWQIQPACRAYHNASQAITSGTWTLLSFNQERFDTDNMHSTVTNPSRFTVPTGGAGLYLIGATIQIAATGARTTGIQLLVNGTSFARDVRQVSGTPAQAIVHCAECLVSLNVGDYFEVHAYCDDGSGSAVVAGNWSPEAWAIFQRRQ